MPSHFNRSRSPSPSSSRPLSRSVRAERAANRRTAGATLIGIGIGMLVASALSAAWVDIAPNDRRAGFEARFFAAPVVGSAGSVATGIGATLLAVGNAPRGDRAEIDRRRRAGAIVLGLAGALAGTTLSLTYVAFMSMCLDPRCEHTDLGRAAAIAAPLVGMSAFTAFGVGGALTATANRDAKLSVEPRLGGFALRF